MTRSFSLPHPFGRLVLVERGLDEAFGEAEQAMCRALPPEASRLRRATFVAGRVALAEAARAHGLELEDAGWTPRGAPRLPAGFSGSVSHKRLGRGDEVRVVASALVAPVRSGREALGVDLECKDPARPEIASRILTARERASLSGDDTDWPRVLAAFSVKESIYKAVDPFLSRYVGFLEAELDDPGPAWPGEGGRYLGARLETSSHEPALEIESYLQSVAGRSELILSAARATLRAG